MSLLYLLGSCQDRALSYCRNSFVAALDHPVSSLRGAYPRLQRHWLTVAFQIALVLCNAPVGSDVALIVA